MSFGCESLGAKGGRRERTVTCEISAEARASVRRADPADGMSAWTSRARCGWAKYQGVRRQDKGNLPLPVTPVKTTLVDIMEGAC